MIADRLACAERSAGLPVWRLILDGRNGASWNMAVDEAILEAVSQGIALPTLRFYRWGSAAISLGRFQDAPRGVDLNACGRLGIPVVRRPTGGRAVLHEEDETISVVVPESHLGPAGSSVVKSYTVLARGFSLALLSLGVATIAGAAERRTSRGGDCFASRSQADLIAPAGEKVLGSAQCRRAGALLQQTSLRHRAGVVDPAQVFRGPVGPEAYPLAGLTVEQLRQALSDGFRRALGIVLQAGELSGWECERAGVLMDLHAARPIVDRQTAV